MNSQHACDLWGEPCRARLAGRRAMPWPAPREAKRERGVALVIVMMTITLLAAMVASLALVVLTETAIAGNYREAAETLYAAEAAVEFALQEIARVEDWSDLVRELGESAFVNGPFQDLVPGVAGTPRVHVAVWLTEQIPELADDGAPQSVISVVGEAFGPRGSRRAVEVLVEKGDSSAVRVLAWRELP